MDKISRQRQNRTPKRSQALQEPKIQWILSPFVHTFDINKFTKCLFNAITLKKRYIGIQKYAELLADLSKAKPSQTIEQLIEQKFLVPKGFNPQKVFDSVADSLLKKEPCPSISYVLVTDFCNFRCGYCFIESSLNERPSTSMTKEVANKVIKVLIEAAKNVKKYRVTFYGGEPLSNGEIVFYIIEKLQQALPNKFSFSCLTNGSYVTENIAQKLKQHNVSIGLSLDGWANIGKNRRLTNGQETFYPTLKALSILKQAHVDVGISCTITKQNYQYAEEIVEFFHKLGITSVGFNLLTRIADAGEFEVPDPKKLAYHLFMAYLKAEKLRMFEDRIGKRRASYFFKEIFHVYDCPAFGEQIFFSPTGTVGPCQAFYPSGKYQIPITDNFRVKQEPLFYKWLELGTLKNKECMSCPAIGICGGACGYDVYIKTGQIGVKENYFCNFQNEILKLLLAYNYLSYQKKHLPIDV